jgi:hypothetical protein
MIHFAKNCMFLKGIFTGMHSKNQTSRNVDCMVPYKVYVFVDQKYTKETRSPKEVSIYMGINYLLFVCFLWGFLNAFL